MWNHGSSAPPGPLPKKGTDPIALLVTLLFTLLVNVVHDSSKRINHFLVISSVCAKEDKDTSTMTNRVSLEYVKSRKK